MSFAHIINANLEINLKKIKENSYLILIVRMSSICPVKSGLENTQRSDVSISKPEKPCLDAPCITESVVYRVFSNFICGHVVMAFVCNLLHLNMVNLGHSQLTSDANPCSKISDFG